MAQKFGGEYSPNGSQGAKGDTPKSSQSYKGPSKDPVGARSNVMFVPAIVIMATSLWDGATALALGLISALLWTLGAWLLRDGIRAQAEYDERKVARRPAIPRKIFSAVLVSLGVGLAAYKNDGQAVAAIIFALCALGLYIAAFGLDPMSDKGMEGIDTFQQDRVAKAIDTAERHVQAMKDAIKRTRTPSLEARVDRFAETARKLFRTVEEDPRDLTSARKYLSVYLEGARDATIRFADIFSRSSDTAAQSDYLALLDDLEENFAARTEKLLQDDRTDLTVEIEVLKDRLNRESKRHS